MSYKIKKLEWEKGTLETADTGLGLVYFLSFNHDLKTWNWGFSISYSPNAPRKWHHNYTKAQAIDAANTHFKYQLMRWIEE